MQDKDNKEALAKRAYSALGAIHYSAIQAQNSKDMAVMAEALKKIQHDCENIEPNLRHISPKY
ncbi:hypothetical protein VCHA53O466_40192 [Vibrio chagasii]|nr:hypothetical protein VCHA53O466_40192 [Vibrio chagasii]